MNIVLQNTLPNIAKALKKDYIVGECCVTLTPEDYLTKRAITHFYYSDLDRQALNLKKSIKYSVLSSEYRAALLEIIDMFRDNPEFEMLQGYDNVYVLFGFYCPLHLQNSKPPCNKNLIIYILPDYQPKVWDTVRDWTGLSSLKKYLGYNNYLPYDQY